MSAVRLLGGQKFAWLSEVGASRTSGCSWHLARRESDGARCLVQLWDPRPTDRELDKIKESFLACFLDTEALDHPTCSFGFDENHAWFLQTLAGAPLGRVWPDWGPERRRSFQAHLLDLLGNTRHPRLLAPDAIGLLPGLTLIPRVIGAEPWSFEGLMELLPGEGGTGADPEPVPTWEQPREFQRGLAHPIRGRSRELTYIKSLMFGLAAPAPMERVIILQGETGLGKERLASWAAAAAEAEGLWVHHLEVQHGESRGSLFNRILQNLLAGFEAEFYSHRPDLARGLSRRLESFAFLAGGRPPKDKDAPLTEEEFDGALEVMEFAEGLHPRLFQLSSLERADPEGLALVAQLALPSRVPWLITLPSGDPAGRTRSFLSAVKAANLAVVNLNRLEDEDLRLLVQDFLGAHELPEEILREVFRLSLGNPGLLQSFLELAIQGGDLAWVQGRWRMVGGKNASLRAPEDLMRQVLLGRLQRLRPAASALVRVLSLADHPLAIQTLGSALGLAGEPLEEAVQNALSSRLVQIQDGRASMEDPQVRELVLSNTSLPDLKRFARALLGALRQEGGGGVLSVRLQSLASDEATALAQVMGVIEQGSLLSPSEAERVVQQALALDPGPVRAARLWEFLSDCLARGWQEGLSDAGAGPGDDQGARALGALVSGLEHLQAEGSELGVWTARARMLGKKAFLEIGRRRVREAAASLDQAAECLADHPLHPEQARLRQAQGRLAILQGNTLRGIRVLEEGLQLLGQSTQKGEHRDHVSLLVELGRALAHTCQFQRAAAMLQSAHRLLEHDQDFRTLVGVQIYEGNLALAQGQPESAHTAFREALRVARLHGASLSQAKAHLALGIFRGIQQLLGPSLSHLDRALERFQKGGDTPMTVQCMAWKARTLAALGDVVQSEHLLLQALALPQDGLSPLEQGDHVFLQAEICGFQARWREAANLFAQAAEIFGPANLSWRERMSQVRAIQCQALSADPGAALESLEPSWVRLEALKGPVEGSASRWLELEWHRAHALLLNHAALQEGEAAAAEALSAWGEVLAAARELRFPAAVMEASARVAGLLLGRGEKLGARSRLQDAFQSFQELWTRIPESHESLFLGRNEMHRFRQAVEDAGLRFVLPERVDPLSDWTPTQSNLPTLQLQVPVVPS
ncbi:MAG: hypothetical protein HY823_12720 [Acidobacteria bacterium]|nr:hypothetical protein [Acidobacteriota bacterium]